MLASSPLVSSLIPSPAVIKQINHESANDEENIEWAGTLSSTSNHYRRGTEPFAKIMSNMDKAALERAAAFKRRSAALERWKQITRFECWFNLLKRVGCGT